MDIELTRMPARRRCRTFLLTSSGTGASVASVGAVDCDADVHLRIANRSRPPAERLDTAREVVFGLLELAPAMGRHDTSYSPEGGEHPIPCPAHAFNGRKRPEPPRDAEQNDLDTFAGPSSVALLRTGDGRRLLFALPHDVPDDAVRTIILERFAVTVHYSVINAGSLACAEPVMGREFPIVLLPADGSPAVPSEADVLQQVRDGTRSVRNAARTLGRDTDAVQMAAFGEIRQ